MDRLTDGCARLARIDPLSGVLTAALVLVAHWLGAQFLRPGGTGAAVWSATAGISMLVLVTADHSAAPWRLAGVVAGTLLGAVSTGDDTATAAATAGAAVVQASLGALVLRARRPPGPWLHGRPDGVRLLAAITVGVLGSVATLAAVRTGGLGAAPPYLRLPAHAAEQALGLLLVVPGFLLGRHGANTDHTPRSRVDLEWALQLAATLAVSGWVFWATTLPAALLLLPILWGALRLGPVRSTLSILAAAAVATAGTVDGPGIFVRPAHPVPAADLRLLLAVVVTASTLTLWLTYQRERANRELAASASLVAQILHTMPDALLTCDAQGRIRRMNAQAVALFGYSEAELIGQSVERLVPAASAAGHVALRRRYLTAEPPRPLMTGADVCAAHADGHEIPVEVNLVLGTLDGEPAVVATVRDVTAIRRAERELGQSRDLLAHVLAAATEQSIIATDPDGMITVFNAGAERMLGYTAAEMVGVSDPRPLHDPDEIQARARELGIEPGFRVFVAQVGSGSADAREWTYIGKDGSRRPVLLTVTAMRGSTGEIVGYIGIAVDVSEQRRARAAMAEARDTALAANTAKSAFLATMSHEIRTPMNAVIGMTGMLLDTGLDTEQRDLVQTVRDSGDHLLTLINDVLDSSKIESGELELELAPFDLRECVEGAVSLLAGDARHLELITDVDPALPDQVEGDFTRLRQVLVNLIGNATKFTADGEVRVSVEPAATDGATDAGEGSGPDQLRMTFTVADTGIGIPPEAMDRLFSSFTQADPSTARVYGGTGLGLAISRGLVEALGGRLEVTSEVGAGSAFAFTLAFTPSPASSDCAGTPSPDLRGSTALVVDDNPSSRRVLRRQLESRGMRCLLAASAEQAMALLGAESSVDVALVDLRMPDVDGQELAGMIREQPRWARLPLVLMSGIGARAIGPGTRHFAAHLGKPVRSSTLAQTLAGVLGHPDPTPVGSCEPAPRPARGGRSTLRVLLVEDNLVNQRVGQMMLRKLGHVADLAGDGEEAVRAAARGDYHTILMDLHMPVMDGLTATRLIRAELAPARQPRIIALTASVTAQDRRASQDAGMDGFLGKPIRLEDLAMLFEPSRPTEPAAAPPRIGDLQAFTDDLVRHHARVARYGHCYGLAVIGLDDFAAFTRAVGPGARDATVLAVGDDLRAGCRSSEGIFYLGHGRFALVMPEQGMAGAQLVARRSVDRIAALALPHPGHAPEALTASAGVTTWHQGGSQSADDVLADAVRALERAGLLGGGQVERTEPVAAPRRDHTIPAPRRGEPAESVLDEAVLADLAELDTTEGTGFLATLVTTYRGQAAALIETIREAIERDDRSAVAAAAHSLCGSSAGLGARAVSAAAKQLELAAPDAEPEPIRALLEQIERAQAMAAQALNEVGVHAAPDVAR